ncbi:TonB-dependent receptor family protein [Brumimicrobium aurantiacum]|uniref:TonB-dependent receptor n=1 Tax=Brumimicrobium aurantiacum TaxID=1737063 RepID=A0A3E1EVS0_9FLAO|nr:TonB-dependent receptor [Brumimicrobium aurantiacum]RFC53612.1 TonB-dependent receptor [Brumimicrobium aurantiacum]
MKLVVFAIALFFVTFSFGQEIYRGKVLDKENDAIPGVKIHNLTSGALKRTSIDGDFAIAAQPKDTLVFSFSYYDSLFVVVGKELKLGGKNLLFMKYQTQDIEEVMIIQKRMADFNVGFMPPIKGVRLNTGTNSIIELENLSGAKSTGNAREMYAKVPGLNIWENDGAGIQVGIGGRGLSPKRTANFNTRQNGYDISADALGYPESYYTPPIEALKSIEIIRGSAALQFGTQFGGLLNFEILDPVEHSPFEFTSRNTVGSYGYFSTFNRVSGTHNRMFYQAYHQYKRGDGYRDNSAFYQHQAFAQLGYYLNENWKVSAEFTHMNYLTKQAGGLTDVNFEEDPRQSVRDRNWFAVDWNLLALRSTYELSKTATLNVRAFGMVSNRRTIGFLGKITQTDQGGNREMIYSDFMNGGVEARFLKKYSWFKSEQNEAKIKGALLIGARVYQGETKTEQGTAADGDDANFIFVNPDDVEGSSFTYPSLNQAVFAENMFFIGKKLRINLGVRIENIETQSSGFYKQYVVHPLNFDTLSISTINDSNVVERTVPLFGAGVSYKTGKKSNLYTNITQNYRAINFTDIRVTNPNVVVDPDIKDEYGFTSELGFRGLLNDLLIYDLSAFYIFYGDKIGLAPKPKTIKKERTNIGDAQNYGLELFSEIDWLKLGAKKRKWTLKTFVNTSYINANYITSKEPNYVGNKVEYVSEFMIKTGISSSFKNWTLKVQYSYNSSQFSDASNAEEASGDAVIGLVPAYAVFDFSGKYAFKKFFQVEFGVNNFTNASYFTRRATGYPGPGILPSDGISGYVTLQFKFTK